MHSSTVIPWTNDREATDDDTALVLAARRQRTAFAPLYHRYRDRVYWYVRTRTPGDDDAADLTQQIFVRALDGIARFRPERGTFAAWLFTIGRNTLTSYHQRQRPTVAWDLVPESLHATSAHSPEAEAVRREDLERLGALIKALSADKRELLVLRFVAGLTVGEIASVIGKGEAATRKQLARTLHRLAADFEGADR
jgi:RNA polymerase sigma-70 factor (ECF subfamily)